MRAPEWNQNFALDIREIDEQHQHFFSILREVYDAAFQEELSRESATVAINHLANYAFYHFDTEEGYCRRAHYAGTEEHHALHQVFCKRTEVFLERARDPSTDLKVLMSEVSKFATDWLADHILKQDTKFVPAMKEAGIA